MDVFLIIIPDETFDDIIFVLSVTVPDNRHIMLHLWNLWKHLFQLLELHPVTENTCVTCVKATN